MSHGVGSGSTAVAEQQEHEVATGLADVAETAAVSKPPQIEKSAPAASATAAEKKAATAQAAKHTVTLQLEPAVFDFFAAAAAADERSLNQFLARKLKALKQSEEAAD